MTVLIAYASALGSTREIAERIASRMATVLGEVECRPVDEVGSVSGYDAVLVGSAIHSQAWLPPASQFFARQAPDLAKRAVWAFSVGMADALPRPFRRRGAALQEQRLANVLSNEAPLRGHKLFSGVYEASQMPAPLRVLFRLIGGSFGDLRDWAAIDAWADQVAAELAKPASPTSPSSVTP